jgi:hypothetical protein
VKSRLQGIPPIGELGLLLLLLPALVLADLVWAIGVKQHFRMLDFGAFRSGAIAVLHGHSPYPQAVRSALLPSTHLVYPPLVAYVMAPFALLPPTVAGAIWFVLMTGCVVVTLAVLDVRDWRCYALAFAGYPVADSLGYGTLGPVLALAVALLWRWRSRPVAAAAVLALALVAKLFLWPLVVWLAATRRWRAAALTLLLSSALFLVPFAPLGWTTLRSYPHLLNVLNRVFGPQSYSIHNALRLAGVRGSLATTLTVLVGLSLCVAIVLLASRGLDQQAFIVAITTAVVLSPISWLHYYVLLLVPLSVARPRLSALWAAPVAYWACGVAVAGTPARVVGAPGVWSALAITAVITLGCALSLPALRRSKPAPAEIASGIRPEAVP